MCWSNPEEDKMGDRTRVRSPLVEGILIFGQDALAKPGRTLTVHEENLLRTIFKDSIDYGLIRIALTNVGAKGRPYTFGNTIRIPPKSDFKPDVLVHETTHVWQYQTQGSGYLSDSAWHQMVDGDESYHVTLKANQSIYGYTAERQAVIVEAYYVDRLRNPPQPATQTDYDPYKEEVPVGWSKLPDVIRMIGEVQRARPMSDSDAFQERMFGPGWNRPDPLPPSPGTQPNEILPILRIEFDGP
jgi:hypothetical protein